jgi:hypothetical protein
MKAIQQFCWHAGKAAAETGKQKEGEYVDR